MQRLFDPCRTIPKPLDPDGAGRIVDLGAAIVTTAAGIKKSMAR